MDDLVEHRSFLLIGAQRGDSVTAKLKALGIPYRIKLLESGHQNWKSINDILTGGNVRAVVARLSAQSFRQMSEPGYRDAAEGIMSGIGKIPHVVFVHEDTLSGDFDPERVSRSFREPLSPHMVEYYRHIFSPPSDEERKVVNELLSRNRISIIPYRTNAELSVLASSFIDDAEKNLLFRVYVPSGRLYAAEAEKLLSLFHEWLQRTGRSGVRRDGYKTAAGQVFEFLGGDDLRVGGLSQEFADFSKFLDLCVEDPSTAEASLCQLGVERSSSNEMVARYSREVRRLQLDLKHERESRMLRIRHNLEAEVLDLNTPARDSSRAVQDLVESLVPQVRSVRSASLLGGMGEEDFPSMVVNLNPQFVHAVESTVLQNIQGTVQLGVEARQLIELARQYGGAERGELESAVHELEDQDARTVDRFGARQRLKGFLRKITTTVESAALGALQAYLESKLSV
ncbi:hypothetical protein ACIQCJ_07945 [Streptomyces sp. NPDC093221]|uniref:hypothetical protein n=1 Tax=Streptomyces sp. NPDC093221 TaxID=3366032 RepID=UPI003801E99B